MSKGFPSAIVTFFHIFRAALVQTKKLTIVLDSFHPVNAFAHWRLPSKVAFATFLNTRSKKMLKTEREMISANASYNADVLIANALHCLEQRLTYGSNQLLDNSRDVCAYARLQMAQEKDEVFAIMPIDNCNRLLAFEKLFYGTVNEAVVYPRKIVRRALEHNAVKMIIVHNHPSGNCEPSSADAEMTRNLKYILGIIDVQLVDHIVVGHHAVYSFAEHGLL